LVLFLRQFARKTVDDIVESGEHNRTLTLDCLFQNNILRSNLFNNPFFNLGRL